MCLKYFNVSQMSCGLKLIHIQASTMDLFTTLLLTELLLDRRCSFQLKKHDSWLLCLRRSQSFNDVGVPSHIYTWFNPVWYPLFIVTPFVSETFFFALPCWGAPLLSPLSASSRSQPRMLFWQTVIYIHSCANHSEKGIGENPLMLGETL